MLNLGHGQAADELFIAMRNAMWQKDADGAAYINARPLEILRVTPNTDTAATRSPRPNFASAGPGRPRWI
jgi:hypothetical protein